VSIEIIEQTVTNTQQTTINCDEVKLQEIKEQSLFKETKLVD